MFKNEESFLNTFSLQVLYRYFDLFWYPIKPPTIKDYQLGMELNRICVKLEIIALRSEHSNFNLVRTRLPIPQISEYFAKRQHIFAFLASTSCYKFCYLLRNGWQIVILLYPSLYTNSRLTDR